MLSFLFSFPRLIDFLASHEIDGVRKEKERLTAASSKSSPDAAIKLTSQENVAAIIGPATSGDTKATIQIAQDNQVPVIAPGGTAPELTFENGKLNDLFLEQALSILSKG